MGKNTEIKPLKYEGNLMDSIFNDLNEGFIFGFILLWGGEIEDGSVVELNGQSLKGVCI